MAVRRQVEDGEPLAAERRGGIGVGPAVGGPAMRPGAGCAGEGADYKGRANSFKHSVHDRQFRNPSTA